MPKTTDRTFISMYFPYDPVFFDIPDHILSLLQGVINCFFADRFDRRNLLHI